jgi:ribosomal protein L20A (L18A)
MAAKNFLVKGTFEILGEIRPYSKEVSAPSKLAADHKIKSIFGSNYGCRRTLVKVESIEEVK